MPPALLARADEMIDASQFILKHRRREVYGNVGDRPRREVYGNVDDRPQREHLERLERLGLPLPVIESDREEDYALDPTNANHH